MAKGRKPHHRITGPAPSIRGLFEQGVALQRQGQIDAARLRYQQVLQKQPRNLDALLLLGLIEQEGDPARAVELFRQAVKVDPGSTQALLNLGNALSQDGAYEEALTAYDRALALKPGFLEAMNNRASTLRRLGRLDDALAVYDRVLGLSPAIADAHYNRGNVLRELKRFDEALASYQRALAINPNDAEALNNRGVTLHCLRRFDEALTNYEDALSIRPGYVQALSNRGNTLVELGRFDEALASYAGALALAPGFAEALNNRAATLSTLHRHDEAADDFARLLAIAPEYPYAPGNLMRSRLHCCDWRDHASTIDAIVAAVRAGRRASVPFSFLAIADAPAEQLQCARLFAAEQAPGDPVREPLCAGERYHHERIRVAYLSADFCEHATAYLMAELFETHDRTRFETFAYSFGADDASAMRKRLERAFDHFVDVRANSDREVAEMLRAAEIDIAVDLKGYTQGSRAGILVHRPAPVQVNYLGYPGTMGADHIDYLIADARVIPPGQEGLFSEQVVRLPATYQVNDSKRAIAARTPSRVELGLPASGFVFCSFNNCYKITPPVFDVWMRLLDRVPGSVLWLLADSAVAMRNLGREAEKRGIAPGRLVFAPRMALADHLARQRAADLFLDTLPVNAHTTASDALWAGLPVLTCMGRAFAGRVAGGLLHAIGLPELITRYLVEYEALALRLATTPDLLADIRKRLERNRLSQPLFDAARYRRHLESAYITMWERHRRGETPAGFDVQ